jgi:glycosyltransferase involved in cell wall biosynthesis
MISVIMSVNKDRGYLDASIESVLNQTFKDFEFIIINDGGDERLEEKLLNWKKKDDRIVTVKNPKNIGLTKSLNKGLKIAKYDLIARIDEGDFWEDKKLEYQIKKFKNENIILTATAYHDVIYEENFIISQKEVKIPTEDIDFRKMFIYGLNPIIHSSAMFRKKLFYNSTLKNSEDYELWLRLSFLGKIQGLNEPLIKYTRTNDSLSHDPYKSCQQLMAHIQVYWYFIQALKDKVMRNKFLAGINYSPFRKQRCYHKKKIALKIYSKAKMYGDLKFKILSLILIPELFQLNLEKYKNKILFKIGKYNDYMFS